MLAQPPFGRIRHAGTKIDVTAWNIRIESCNATEDGRVRRGCTTRPDPDGNWTSHHVREYSNCTVSYRRACICDRRLMRCLWIVACGSQTEESDSDLSRLRVAIRSAHRQCCRHSLVTYRH